MTDWDVELGFRSYVCLVIGHPANNDQRQVKSLHRSRLSGNSSFDFCCVKLGQAYANTVALYNALDWFAEHLHGFDFLVDFHGRQLDRVSYRSCSGQNGASNNCTFSFDGEAVIDGKQEVFLRPSVSVWDLNLLQDCRNHIVDSFSSLSSSLRGRSCIECWNWHNFSWWTELRAADLSL